MNRRTRSLFLTLAIILGGCQFLQGQEPSGTSESDVDSNMNAATTENERVVVNELGRQVGGAPPWLKHHNFPIRTFTFVRIQYDSNNKKIGSWDTDYPEADENLVKQIGALTTLDISEPTRVMRLTDAKLSDYPFIYLSEAGNLNLSDKETDALRTYLAGGGFLMIDDFWGEKEWANVRLQIQKVFPQRQILDLSKDHPVFNCVFEFAEPPQVPSILHFLRGFQSERVDAVSAQYRGVMDDQGRLMMIICHNTDLADGWENFGQDEGYTREMSIAKAIPMGINIVFYVLNRRPSD